MVRVGAAAAAAAVFLHVVSRIATLLHTHTHTHTHNTHTHSPSVGHNRDDAVHAGRELPELEMLHRACRNERTLRIIKHMGHRVHALPKVRRVNSHSLLTHSTLVRITGTLVVIRERNDRSADAEDHRGVNLTVREGLCENKEEDGGGCGGDEMRR